MRVFDLWEDLPFIKQKHFITLPWQWTFRLLTQNRVGKAMLDSHMDYTGDTDVVWVFFCRNTIYEPDMTMSDIIK